MNIKEVFNSLGKKPIITLLTIIQLLIFLVVSIQNYSNYKNNVDDYKIIENIISKDNYCVKIIGGLGSIDLEKLNELHEFIRSNDEIDFIPIVNSEAFVYSDKLDNKFIDPRANSQIIDNKKFESVKTVQINEKFNELIPKEKNKIKLLPNEILLGEAFKNYYTIGDTIEIINSNKQINTFQVRGFIDKNIKTINTSEVDVSIQSIEDSIIMPMEDYTKITEEGYKKFFLLKLITDGIIKVDKNTVLEDLQMKINGVSDYTKILNIKNIAHKQLEKSRGILEYNIFIFGLILLFSIIGIITGAIRNINKNLREYGIHIMLGATKKDIVKRVIFETVLLFIITIFISLIYFIYSVKSGSVFYSNISIVDFMTVNILFLLLGLIATIIPALKVISYEITDFVRRYE